METQMTQLNIPVPPAPVLEQAVGYRNYRGARYLALWWAPCGDEAMVSDGLVTFTGLWPGYLAYVQHRAVHPQVAAYHLGSSEDPAEYTWSSISMRGWRLSLPAGKLKDW